MRQAAPGSGRDAVLVAAIAACALVVRVVAWQRTAALFNDGPVFIGLGRLVAAGEWGAVIAHPYHPLYPIAIALAHPLFGDWERGAAAVSIAAGSAAVAVLYGFLRDAFDRRVAVLGAAILAIHPFAVGFSADVQSDGLYLAFFLAAVALLWRALRSARSAPAAAAGALTGLAYLVRPEGVGVLAVGVAWVGLRVLRRRWDARRGLITGAALLAGGGIAMSPYLIALRWQGGTWRLTQKKSIAALSGFEAEAVPWNLDVPVAAGVLAAHPFLETVVRGPRLPPVAHFPAGGGVPPAAAAPRPPAPGRIAGALGELYRALVSTLRFELAPLLLLGALSLRGPPGFRGGFVLSLAGLYLGVLYALALAVGYVSRRHALPPVALALGYVALGVPVLGRLAAAPLRRLRGPGRGPSERLATALAAALLVAVAAPQSLQSRRVDSLAERRAAEWLRDRPERAGAVAAARLRVAYYADSPYVPLRPADGSGAVLAYLRAADARYMIVDDRTLAAHRELEAAARESMRVVHRTEAGGRSAAVFAIDREH